MGSASSLSALFAFRALDGAVHLPAVTLLMVAANRAAGDRRGASLGALASALMLGITVGSPLGGWLVERGPDTVYRVGAAVFVLAAIACLAAPVSDVAHDQPANRYRFQWRRAGILGAVRLRVHGPLQHRDLRVDVHALPGA